MLLRHQTPLAQVRGAYNAIHVVGDAVGDTLYYGQGAGQMPTASAVVADIIDLAVGRAQRTFQTLRLWSGSSRGIRLRPASTVREPLLSARCWWRTGRACWPTSPVSWRSTRSAFRR